MRGREMVVTGNDQRGLHPDRGELVPLDWKGGVREKLKIEKKPGTFKYLATWQGLRNEDLDLELEGERIVVCTKTRQAVVFSSKLPDDEE